MNTVTKSEEKKKETGKIDIMGDCIQVLSFLILAPCMILYFVVVYLTIPIIIMAVVFHDSPVGLFMANLLDCDIKSWLLLIGGGIGAMIVLYAILIPLRLCGNVIERGTSALWKTKIGKNILTVLGYAVIIAFFVLLYGYIFTLLFW